MDAGIAIKSLATTSGGSVVGLAVAAGLDGSEIRQLSIDEPMSGLLTRNPLRLMWAEGLDSGDALYRWLDRAYGRRKMGNARIPIQVISTDLATGAFVFSPTSAPDVPMALAARASAAVPKVWDPVRYQGRYLYDGGMCANIPVDYLPIDGTPRIGVKVMEADKYDVSTRLARDASMLSRLIEANEDTEMHLGAALGVQIIKVDAGNAGFLDCNLPTATRAALFQAGYDAMNLQILKLGK
jgi:NTE family protein